VIGADYESIYKENMALKVENQRLMNEYNVRKSKESLLQSIDFDALSPKKAFDLLWEYKEN
jgi:hypothetical protein